MGKENYGLMPDLNVGGAWHSPYTKCFWFFKNERRGVYTV
jgi:hypothetical protein